MGCARCIESRCTCGPPSTVVGCLLFKDTLQGIGVRQADHPAKVQLNHVAPASAPRCPSAGEQRAPGPDTPRIDAPALTS